MLHAYENHMKSCIYIYILQLHPMTQRASLLGRRWSKLKRLGRSCLALGVRHRFGLEKPFGGQRRFGLK